MPLKDDDVRKEKPGAKPRKIADSGGLFLLVNPNGSKLWRFKFRINGKEKALALGAYPDVSLRKARDRRDEARRMVADGIDPAAERQRAKAEAKGADTFAAVAAEWLERQRPTWTEGHARTVRARLENDVLPYLGKRAIREIEPPDVLAVLRRVEERGAIETAHRIKTVCAQVFAYAVATTKADRNPVTDLKGALTSVTPRPMAAVTDPREIGALLRSIDDYKGTAVVRAAFRLAPLVFLRPGELRGAEWAEIDLDAATWVIPARRMKLRKAYKDDPQRSHIVPLSRQAVEILRDLRPLTGRGRFVFPGGRSDGKPLSENAILAALRRMGYDRDTMTGHGFRVIASTVLNERGFNPDAIEAQLAHIQGSKVRAAYNRALYLEDRTKMMQAWADHLDALKAGAEIIPFRRAGA